MERAFIRLGDNKYLIGHGPFQKSAKAPTKGIAFYRNNFALSDTEPWHIPQETQTCDTLQSLWPQKTPNPKWEPISIEAFADIFKEANAAIQAGKLEKSVPAMSEIGQWQGPGQQLLEKIQTIPPTLTPYGWQDGTDGVLGASPELLFSLQGSDLRTMALAGTARTDDLEAFAADQKEIREHEYVAQSLSGKLSELGNVVRTPRKILHLGSLVHFHSAFQVKLEHSENPENLIKKLHPTPALGPLPRTQETLQLLYQWRKRLQCPSWFGAPFGISINGHQRILVSIRMLYWKGAKIYLPAGCGIIEASRLVNEWRELRLKRQAIKTLFNL